MQKSEQAMDKALGHGDYAPKGVPEPEPVAEPAAPPAEPAKTALVPVDEMLSTPLVPLSDGKIPVKRFATSLNPHVAAEGVLAYRAQQDHDVSGDDWLNQVIEVEHWLMHDYTRVDDTTGEISQRVRTVLITPDGKRYGFSSDGIANSVCAINKYVRRAPWRPAIKVKLVAKRSSADRRYFTLDLIA